MEEPKKPDTPTKRVRPVIPAHAFVFIASFCLMVIELVAGRIMAPYLGSSLYTWTAVIGVVLTGITLGNYAGGVIAERGSTWRTVGMAFAFAGFASVFSFYTYEPISRVIFATRMPLEFSSLLFALAGFFPLSFLLSLVTPIVITLSLNDLKKTGTTVGSIYAVSAAASIIGTFATGYFLIAFLTVKTIVTVVAAVLLLTGIVAAADKQLTTGVPMIFAVALLWLSLLAPQQCTMETSYYCIRVRPTVFGGGGGKVLLLDHLVHSYVFGDPRKLAYDYEVVYSIATEYEARRTPEDRPLRSLFLGGGGYTMPRFIEANYPGAEMTVVEIDPGVTKAAQKYLGLAPVLEGPIWNHNEDARMFMMHGVGDAKYDIIFGDAFNDYSIPYHLTTKEFVKLLDAHLSPRGMYALNVIDDYQHGELLASFMKTIGEVFPHVEVAPLNADWQKPKRNTYVVLASREPIDLDLWEEAGRVAYAETLAGPVAMAFENATFLLSEEEKRSFVDDRRRSVTLTDNYVPVDNFIAPLFTDDYGN